MELNPILTGWTIALLIGLPVLSARDRGEDLDDDRIRAYRRTIYASVAVSLILIAGTTAGVAVWQAVPGESLGWKLDDAGLGVAWGIGTAVAGLGVAWVVTLAAAALGWRESRLAFLLMPRDGGETRSFLLLSGLGAVCEEYVYRGFLLHALLGLTGVPWLAALGTAISFGLAHGYQRLAGITRATLLGALLAVPVLVTGSLFPAIVAHFWVNAAIGVGGWRWLVRHVTLEEPKTTADSVEGNGERDV